MKAFLQILFIFKQRLYSIGNVWLPFFYQEMSSVLRRPTDPEEDLRLMAQEVRDYVEAVLNSLAANVPKVSLRNCGSCCDCSRRSYMLQSRCLPCEVLTVKL